MAWIGENVDAIVAMITAAGALGTAAAGLVETQKGEAGWAAKQGFTFDLTEDDLRSTLGPDGWSLLEQSYGSHAMALFRGAHRAGGGELEAVLRAGLRLGVRPENAALLVRWFELHRSGASVDDVAALAKDLEAPEALLAGDGDGAPSAADLRMRRLLGELELRLDALVKATVASAAERYKARMRSYAAAIAVGIGGLVGFAMALGPGGDAKYLVQGLLVGLIAVPVAPIAKDLTGAIVTVRDALARRAP